jgi:hypothetical protein
MQLVVLQTRLSARSLLSSGVLCPLTTPLQQHRGSMHAWSAIPPDWECLGHPPAETTIDLHIALKSPTPFTRSAPPAIQGTSAHECTPCIPLLRHKWARTSLRHRALEPINSWLKIQCQRQPAAAVIYGGNWLTLTGVPVSQANALLGASYQLYQHAETKDCVLSVRSTCKTVCTDEVLRLPMFQAALEEHRNVHH